MIEAMTEEDALSMVQGWGAKYKTNEEIPEKDIPETWDLRNIGR
jgi:hypothetical protein